MKTFGCISWKVLLNYNPVGPSPYSSSIYGGRTNELKEYLCRRTKSCKSFARKPVEIGSSALVAFLLCQLFSPFQRVLTGFQSSWRTSILIHFNLVSWKWRQRMTTLLRNPRTPISSCINICRRHTYRRLIAFGSRPVKWTLRVVGSCQFDFMTMASPCN